MSESSESSRRRRMPRQEAQPQTWRQLTEEQQQVVRDIHEWVLSFLDQELKGQEDKRSTPFEWTIDPERRSNVILIDGGRGSGKTSVMLSVLRLWNELLGQGENWRKDWEPLVKPLESLKGRLITVPVLDLEPLPGSTSLLPWIAGRVLKLGEDIEAYSPEDSGTHNRSGKWSPEYEQEPEWKKAWRELLQDAAAGWSERVADLRGALDAEAFATELVEENRARLLLLEHWRKFITAVLTSAASRFGSLIQDDVRLVISIDDADMNPHRCAELLKLLRMLWHPRVIFMLTGHSDLFHKTLRLQFRGVFRQLQYGSQGRDSEEADSEELQPTAKTLAFQVYDKAIPPPHRFALSPLSFEQRLGMLRDVLEVPIQQRSHSGRPGSLREYFEFNPYALPALPAWLRKVQDFQQVALGAGPREVGTIAYELWKDALGDELGQIPAEQISNVQRMVGLIGDRLHLRGVDQAFQRRTRRTKHVQFQGEANLLKFSEATGLVHVLNVGDQGTRPMPERLNAALLLIADLVYEERDEQFDVPSLMPSGMEHDLVQNELVHLDRRITNPGAFIRGAPSTTWMLPDWKLALDFALFETHWNRALRTWKMSSRRPAFMAGAFLWGVLAVWKRTTESLVPSHAEEPDWTGITLTLLEETAALEQKDRRSEYDEAFLEWLRSRALLLAAPESGLPAPDANRLLSEWRTALKKYPQEFQERMITAVSASRRAQVDKINTSNMQKEEFLQDVDARFSQHQWGRLIEMRTESGRSLVKLLREDLSHFSIRHPFFDTLKEPGTLLAYAERLGVNIPVSPALVEQLKKKLQTLRNVHGQMPHALIGIWQFLVNEQGIQGDRVHKIHLNDTQDVAIVELPWELEEQLTRFRIERVGIRVRRNLEIPGAEFRLHSVKEPPPPDGLDQFLMLAHDVVQDESDPQLPWLKSEPDETWFASTPHAGTSFRFKDEEVTFGWPVPRWPAFIDWKLEEKHLVSIEEQAIEVLESNSSSTHARRILAAFAQGVLDICWTVIERREQDQALHSTSERRIWIGQGRRARDAWDPLPPSPGSNQKPQQGNRWEAFKAWAKLAVPLYAAPELGLAPRFATALLGGWTRQLDWSSTEASSIQRYVETGAEDVRRLRRGWARNALQEAGMSEAEEEVTLLLHQVDHANPQHPWHEVFGPDSSDKEG